MLYNELNHKDINNYIENNVESDKDNYNFFASEDINFLKDLNFLNETDNFNVENVSNVVPLNIYYKKKFTKKLNKKIQNCGGRKVFDTISDFLKSIDCKKGGLKEVYTDIGELLSDLTRTQESDQESLIRNVLSNLLTTSSFNTYDINLLKKKISMINTFNNTRDEKELNRVMFDISTLVNRLKSLEKKGIKIQLFDDDNLKEKLEKVFFQSIALYQYLNIVEVVRNLFCILPTYNVSITNTDITKEDLMNIDKMFLQQSLLKKNKLLKKRFEDLKSNINIKGETQFETIVDEIYKIPTIGEQSTSDDELINI